MTPTKPGAAVTRGGTVGGQSPTKFRQCSSCLGVFPASSLKPNQLLKGQCYCRDQERCARVDELNAGERRRLARAVAHAGGALSLGARAPTAVSDASPTAGGRRRVVLASLLEQRRLDPNDASLAAEDDA